MKLPIYMDYMATTPVDPAVAKVLSECLQQKGCFGNPASQSHRYGWAASERVRIAEEQVADLIHADSREIVWTSGATESDNLAIKGAALFYQRKGKHIITMRTEHKAVLDTCVYLESQGFEVTYLDPECDGLLDLEKLKAAIRPDTILISIMHVNNETGVIQDIEAIGKLTRDAGIIFHSDAAQSVGKVEIDVTKIDVDLLSFSGHKLYGPKGIGVLYVRRTPRVRLEAQIHGGGHQRGMRSGTLATHQIVAMGEAFHIAKEAFENDCKRISKLRDRLWEGISKLGSVHLNGHPTQHVCSCLNVRFDGIEAENLLASLRDLAVSSGSACNSANPEPSHVLSAMSLSRDEANRSVRFSVGRFTTDEELDYAIKHITEQIQRLREASPLWDKAKEAAIQRSGES